MLKAATTMEKVLLLFGINTFLNPANTNVFNWMGEYYFKTGNKSPVKENYLKMLGFDAKYKNT